MNNEQGVVNFGLSSFNCFYQVFQLSSEKENGAAVVI